MREPELSEMTTQDYDEVFALWSQSEGVVLSEADSQENFRRYLERNPGMSFVARMGGCVVGAVLCGHDGRRGHIYHLAVAPRYRKQGIAKSLLQKCFDKLQEERISLCRATVKRDNPEGQQFWEKAGWSPQEHLIQITRPIDETEGGEA